MGNLQFRMTVFHSRTVIFIFPVSHINHWNSVSNFEPNPLLLYLAIWLAIRLARHINYNLESLHIGSLLTVIKNKIPCRQLWQALPWRFSALLISIVFTSSKFKALSWCFNGFIKHGEDSGRSDALYHRPLCIFRCANLSLLRLSQRFL